MTSRKSFPARLTISTPPGRAPWGMATRDGGSRQRAAALVAMVAGVFAFSLPAMAQEAAPAPEPKWSAQCVSPARSAAPDCSMQQSAVMTQTGQLLAAVTVRVPGENPAPQLLLQVPAGLFLPAGVVMQIDDKPAQTLPLDTCDQNGCYVTRPLDDALLAAFKAGRKLQVTVQNFSKRPIAIPFVLDGFTASYQNIQSAS